MGAEMHAGATPPYKPGFAGLFLALDEIDGSGDGFIIDRFHALFSQRAGVFNSSVSIRTYYTAWTKLFTELRILGVVLVFRLFLGVQVIQVTEKFIETVV